MAEILTNNKNYYDIANTIRQMKNVNTTYKPREMASALKDIYSNEVEGTLPLSFEANGNNLLDYRIDGASGGVGDKTNNLFDGIFLHRSVMGAAIGTDGVNRRSIVIDISNYNNGEKITFSRETALGSVFQMYQISSTQTGGRLNSENVVSGNSNTLLATITITNVNEYPYLMIFLNGESNPIEDEKLIASKIMINVGNTALPYEPYGYKVPVVISGKNLVNKNNMLQGYWAYADGGFVYTNTWICTPKIKCSGDTTYTYQFSNTSRWSGFVFYDKNGNYISTSNKQDISSTPYRTYTATSPSNARYLTVNIAGFPGIADTISVSDLINFQLEKNSTATDYEPYYESTTTIYLDEPIGENESISLSDTNVNIPTIRGTNVLTVDTTVQPSNVYIQAPKDSIEATQIASELEEI